MENIVYQAVSDTQTKISNKLPLALYKAPENHERSLKQVLHNFKQRYRRGQRHYHKQWVGRTRNCFFELTTLLLEVKKLYKKTACGGEGVITFLVKVGLVDAE